MRILTVVADGSRGGGTTHVLQLAGALKRKYGSSRFVVDKNSFLSKKLVEQGHIVHEINMFSLFAPLSSLFLFFFLKIKSVKIDCVHCHGSRGRGIFIFSSFFYKYSVYTVHGYHFSKNGFLKKKLKVLAEKIFYIISDVVIYVCNYDKELALKENISAGEQGKSIVIYNGVEIPSKVFSMDERGNDIVFAGRMVDQKNPLFFLSVLQKVKFKKCAFVGGGALLPKAKQYIDNHRFEGEVDVYGDLDRDMVINLLRESKVLVMTSRWEGFPIITLEAMANGCVVIALNVGGLEEQLEKSCGLAIECHGRNEDEIKKMMVDRINYILSDKNYSSILSQMSYERAVNKFSVNKFVARTLDVYEARA